MMGNAIKNTGWGKSTTFLAWFVESVQVLQLKKKKEEKVHKVIRDWCACS